MPGMRSAPWTQEGTIRRVAVLAGGDSAEREISLASGAAVSKALELSGHTVDVIDPADCPVEMAGLNRFDMTFLALHGTYGEDGGIQQELDLLGVPYTGSGTAASYRAFHKLDAKRRFLSSGLPTPEYVVVPRSVNPSAVRSLARYIGFPIAVKPEAQGSSLGVSIVRDNSELAAAVEQAREYDDCILLERAIPGEEWTVPVLDQMILPPIRISTPHAFYSFAAKYQDGQTRYDVMLDEQQETVSRVRQVALKACQALGCRGLSRVDLRVDPAGNPWLLEVNTLPGMTATSLVPKSAASIGWSMSQLCDAVLASAWNAYSGVKRLRAS